MVAWLKCMFMGHQEPVKVPLGWRCPRCNAPASHMGEFDGGIGKWGGGGWVNPNRKRFSRYRYYGKVGW